MLGCKVVSASGAKGLGSKEIMEAIVYTKKTVLVIMKNLESIMKS